MKNKLAIWSHWLRQDLRVLRFCFAQFCVCVSFRDPYLKEGTPVIKDGPTRPLFRLFAVFSIKHYNFTINQCKKMSNQYKVLGFELSTF